VSKVSKVSEEIRKARRSVAIKAAWLWAGPEERVSIRKALRAAWVRRRAKQNPEKLGPAT
jgi:hypothetical protein